MENEFTQGAAKLADILKDPATLEYVKQNFCVGVAVGLGTLTAMYFGIYAALKKGEFTGHAGYGANIKP